MPGNNTKNNATTATPKSSVVSNVYDPTDDDVAVAASASTHEPSSSDSITSDNSTKGSSFVMNYLEKEHVSRCLLVPNVHKTRRQAFASCCASVAETILFRSVSDAIIEIQQSQYGIL